MTRLACCVLSLGLLAACSKGGQSSRYPDQPAGACSRAPGGTCDVGFVCHYPLGAQCGETGAQGACFPMPSTCTKDYSPVCGCDGRTYVNICVAHSHGVSPRKSGPCADGGAAGQPDGSCGPGGATATCPNGQFCQYDEVQYCGEAPDSGPGECTEKPTTCTKEWAPVCGCDGRNYSNDCVSHSHGVAIRHRGLCQDAAQAPTGAAGAQCGVEGAARCATGLFCQYPPSAQCGEGNRPGKCQPRPQACTAQYDPVCGCDAKTYANACSAQAAGVSIRSEGACP